MMSCNEWATNLSDFVNVGTSALVESDKRAKTPSFPSLAISWKSGAGWFITGVKSNLKSPVNRTAPSGVWTAIPRVSGIEWVVLKKLTDNLSNFKTVSSCSSWSSLEFKIPCSSSFPRIKAKANGVA